MDEPEIQAASLALMSAIQRRIGAEKRAGAQALESGNFAAAEGAIESARLLTDLLAKVQALSKSWKKALAQTHPGRTPIDKRLPVATKSSPVTPEEAYRSPILETLLEMGGSGRVSEILDRVERKLADRLTPYYRQALPKSNAVRWRSKSQWCRLRLVCEGLLRNDSRSGILEISQRGLEALQEGTA